MPSKIFIDCRNGQEHLVEWEVGGSPFPLPFPIGKCTVDLLFTKEGYTKHLAEVRRAQKELGELEYIRDLTAHLRPPPEPEPFITKEEAWRQALLDIRRGR